VEPRIFFEQAMKDLNLQADPFKLLHMIVPVKNLVEAVDLSSEDVLLPLLECVVNSIISLQQSSLPLDERKIQIKIMRGALPSGMLFTNAKTISSFKVTDNGVGFNEKNFSSFETPLSQTNSEYGCKGVGRFTVLAAYKEFNVDSTYMEQGEWYNRKFSFTTDKEIESLGVSSKADPNWRTTVEISSCHNELILEKSALTLNEISAAVMQHCFIYYLNNTLPTIEIFDTEDNSLEVVNRLFEKVAKENERNFSLNYQNFRLYITKTLKEGNRKNNYIHYCANNRTVGNPRNLKNINIIFAYPISSNGQFFFFDIYLVSDYLNKKVYRARNGFNIPKEKENLLFESQETITFQEIEEKVSEILESEYESFVKAAKEKSVKEIRDYIVAKAPRYNSFLRDVNILQSIPPNLPEDKLEEHLYKIAFNARRNVDKNIQKFIDAKNISEESISKIKKDIQEKTAYDVDSLADYMTRRKAILELFDKFLDADDDGSYRLEEDVHNIIFPLGLSNYDLDYENHNLWILDERFITYKFIASDTSITSYSQKNSRKETDLVLIDNPKMFDNPISFGDRNSGQVNSLVIFEFKRPGDVAHQKSRTDYRWEFSELIEPYFEEFLYQPDKKNYKGNQVIVAKNTPKFGYVIVDVIPGPLAEYNENKGWKKTPFGTYFSILPEINLHIEVLTFRQLLDFSISRHNPFFDRLFTKTTRE
jgi:hypothetical protein